MSDPVPLTSSSKTEAGTFNFSLRRSVDLHTQLHTHLNRIDIRRDRTSLACGLLISVGGAFTHRLNFIGNVVACSGFIFGNVGSLQMSTIGIYESVQSCSTISPWSS